jgi:hypothetical protein
MKSLFISLTISLSSLPASAQTVTATTPNRQAIVAQILKQMDYQEAITLRQDTAAMRRYYPDDMRITNPFHMLIDKPTMLARVKANIIKYTAFEKIVEHIHIEGEHTVIVMGREQTKAAPDAPRADADKPVTRRFTEVFVNRNGDWKRLIRHAHNAN